MMVSNQLPSRSRFPRTPAVIHFAFALLLLPLPLLGGVTLSPVAIAGSDLEEYSPSTPFTNMINQSGIATPFVSGETDFDTHFATPGEPFGNANYQNNWQSQADFDLPLTGYVDFDLGAAYRVDQIAIWSLSLRDIRIELLDELGGVPRAVGAFTLTNQLNFPFSYRVEVHALTPSAPARYVRLNIDSVHTYSPTDTFGYAIIGEVAFSVEPAASEPPPLRIDRNADGDVTVTFGGILESASAANDDFTPVSGAPQGTYTIPANGPSTQRYFRARLD
ncbi:MAG: hypothetical protein KJ072_10060 [Verrucomicrobia bacterium]|nr:hypothetical protein [Verrucomicrobiota bacterium]